MVHVTVLLAPMMTVMVAGLYPGRFVLAAAPFGIITFTVEAADPDGREKRKRAHIEATIATIATF